MNDVFDCLKPGDFQSRGSTLFQLAPPCLEAVLEEFALLQRQRKVEDDLRGGDAKVKNAVIHPSRGLQGTQGFLQDALIRPQLE